MSSPFQKYPQGRTIAEAIADGDYYSIVFRKNDDERGFWDGESSCPGAGGIDEALAAARLNFPDRIGRTVFIERILPGSRIGCQYVENCGTATL